MAGPREWPMSSDEVARRHDRAGRLIERVVDQKLAVVPLHADTLADPNKLLASVRSLPDLA
jgi:hypothetical protein